MQDFKENTNILFKKALIPLTSHFYKISSKTSKPAKSCSNIHKQLQHSSCSCVLFPVSRIQTGSQCPYLIGKAASPCDFNQPKATDILLFQFPGMLPGPFRKAVWWRSFLTAALPSFSTSQPAACPVGVFTFGPGVTGLCCETTKPRLCQGWLVTVSLSSGPISQHTLNLLTIFRITERDAPAM